MTTMLLLSVASVLYSVWVMPGRLLVRSDVDPLSDEVDAVHGRLINGISRLRWDLDMGQRLGIAAATSPLGHLTR